MGASRYVLRMGAKSAHLSPVARTFYGTRRTETALWPVGHRPGLLVGGDKSAHSGIRQMGSEKSRPKSLGNENIRWSWDRTEGRTEVSTWKLRWTVGTPRCHAFFAPVCHNEKRPLSKVLTNSAEEPFEGEGKRWSNHRTNRTFLVGILAAFSFFSKSDNQQEGEKDEKSEQEDRIIFLLKKAKLSIMKGELEEAEQILHQAVYLAHESDSNKAILYTYDLMANLAFLRGHFDSAEKLFKAVMTLLLAADTKQDDNAFIEISLKLASIYAAENRHELAVAGYEFCIMTLEEKTEKQKDLPEDALTLEEKANTRLLLGLCMDSYARYLLANKQLPLAQTMCERALKISIEVQGETHPQTIVLMNDLAAILDFQGQYSSAYNQVKRASELAKQMEHPDEHVVLNNMAGILMHQENFAEAQEVFMEALEQAEQKGDAVILQQIKEGLAELSRRIAGP